MSDSGNQTKYKLDVGGTDQPENISELYNPGHPDSGRAPRGDIVEVNQGQDIPRNAKVTLGNYLGAASRGSVYGGRSNAFQLPADTAEAIAGVDPNASTRQSPSTTKGEILARGSTLGTYMDLAKAYTPEAEKFSQTKHSQYSRDAADGSARNPFLDTDIQIKNYSAPDRRATGYDGNSILLNVQSTEGSEASDLGNPNIAPTPETAPILQQKISQVLRNNRFNPAEKAFIQNHTWTSPGVTLQRKLGVHEKDNGKSFKQGLLEQVGLKLIIRATGHSVPGQDLLDPNNNLQDTNNFAPLIPSLPQLTGLPLIDVVNLRAGNVPVVEDLLGVGVIPESHRSEYIADTNGAQFDPVPGSIGSTQTETFTGKSYGTLNSHIEPFGGPVPIGTLTTTIAGILAIVGASALVALLPLLLGSSTQLKPRQSVQDADPSSLVKGKRGFRGTEPETYSTILEDPEFWLEFLGIPRTDHNWGFCVIIGIAAFFGIETLPGVAGQAPTINTASIGEAFFFLALAPGYYTVVIRNAIRDTEQIVRAIEDFAQAAGDTNVIRAISGLFKLIESITTSALYRFIMAMTALGNQVLNYMPDPVNDLQGYPDVEGLRMRSRLDDSGGPQKLNGPRDIASSLKGDLGRTQSSSLAWKHSAPKSLYTMPESFSVALGLARDSSINGNMARGKLLPGADGDENARFRKPPTGGRFSPDTVKKIENDLEAEYVPFYFQDLRTNEIVSFHAFLSDLSDGFTASYNSMSGYGRADEIMVYNNTKRSMSLGFTVAATSREDLDVMYWNINKLISLLYPQYSKGRVMVTGAGDAPTKFIQPFSQIPTSSPMIRLRVGDIIRGNYSKFGLARLFGLGQDGNSFNIGTRDDAARRQRESRRASAVATVKSTLAGREKIPGDKVTINTFSRSKYIWCDASGNSAVTGYNDNREPQFTSITGIGSGPPEGLQAIITSETPLSRGLQGGSVVEIVRIVPPRDESVGGEDVRLDTGQPRYIVKLIRLPGPASRSDRIESTFGNYGHFFIYQSDVSGYDPVYIDELVESQLNNDSGNQLPNQTADATAITEFFSGAGDNGNPIVRAFESTRGRGLAGFITDLKMDWADYTWETSPGDRAPMAMKLSISFAPIHDIPMGLDSDGMMRSVAYNVGSMSRTIGRDQYESDPTSAPAASGGSTTPSSR